MSTGSLLALLAVVLGGAVLVLRRPRSRRSVIAVAAVPVLALGLSACSSSSSSSATTSPSSSTSASTSGSPSTNCTAEALLAAVPAGATLDKFECADVAGTEWAALKVNPGPTVFFLKWSGSAWQAETSDSVCGTASAGLPPKLLAFCPTPSPSTSSTTTVACTSASILAALPAGATMGKFECADVAGTQWAAASVNPGPTVYFLTANGSSWDVKTADEVCGTASAGLPQKLLAFCTS
ncbi:MAG: hypothetical protein U0S36_10965 [Candidatus Nanopelagicales bacterium]